jgi:hypothetical protein
VCGSIILPRQFVHKSASGRRTRVQFCETNPTLGPAREDADACHRSAQVVKAARVAAPRAVGQRARLARAQLLPAVFTNQPVALPILISIYVASIEAQAAFT